jgi:hypothetical protein
MSIVITGATGQLGRLVVKQLMVGGTPPDKIVARHQRVDIDVVEIGGVAGLALHRAAGSARMRAPLSIRKLPRQ